MEEKGDFEKGVGRRDYEQHGGGGGNLVNTNCPLHLRISALPCGQQQLHWCVKYFRLAAPWTSHRVSLCHSSQPDLLLVPDSSSLHLILIQFLKDGTYSVCGIHLWACARCQAAFWRGQRTSQMTLASGNPSPLRTRRCKGAVAIGTKTETLSPHVLRLPRNNPFQEFLQCSSTCPTSSRSKNWIQFNSMTIF